MKTKSKNFKRLRNRITTIKLGDASLKLLILALSIAFIVDVILN